MSVIVIPLYEEACPICLVLHKKTDVFIPLCPVYCSRPASCHTTHRHDLRVVLVLCDVHWVCADVDDGCLNLGVLETSSELRVGHHLWGAAA